MNYLARITALAGLLFSVTFAAQPDARDLARLRTQFLDAFQSIPVGADVSEIKLPSDDWPADAKIDSIVLQTGKWLVHGEAGTSIFRVYPYYDENEGARAGGFSCVVIKLDAERLTTDELLAAFRGHRKGGPLHLVEYSVVYPDGHGFHAPEKKANQAPEPTTLLVMPRAYARVTPSRVVAHL